MIPWVEEFKTNTFETVVLISKGVDKRILLIHGLACTKEIWFLYPLIFPEHTFIAYDQRGFGMGIAKDGKYDFSSYVSDAEAIIKKYQPDLVIGHSFGGTIAQVISSKFKIPAILLQTTSRPPENIKSMTDEELEQYAKRYTLAVRMQIKQAIAESFVKYLFIPFSLMPVLYLMQYSPAFPAMRHLRDVLDFTDLCPEDKDANIVKVMGGKRDTIVSEKEIERLSNCVNKKPEFKDVNHIGILYPDFVYASLKTG